MLNSSFKNKILSAFINFTSRLVQKRRTKAKFCEFKDPRRMSIYKNVTLSKNEKERIDSFYLKNYGKKVSYIWHKHYKAFTGNFDYKYFPDYLYIPEFEHYMNLENSYVNVFGDKNILPMLAKYASVNVPVTIYKCINGICFDSNNLVISLEQMMQGIKKYKEVFLKQSRESYGGHGCLLINTQSINELEFKDIMKKNNFNFIIQEKVVCSKSLREIYSLSVNTFRVITYWWKGELMVLPIILRIGANGNVVDNVSSGGMFIAVENDGKLHDTAYTEFNTKFLSHPQTGYVFKGHIIKNIDKIIDSAKRLHKSIPQIGCVNWDFTLDQNDVPTLIEANTLKGSIDMIQMAFGKGPFGDKTAGILQWLNKCKRRTVDEIINKGYGY